MTEPEELREFCTITMRAGGKIMPLTKDELEELKSKVRYQNIVYDFGHLKNGEIVRRVVIQSRTINALTEIIFDEIREIVSQIGISK